VIKISFAVDIYDWQNEPTEDVLQYMEYDEMPFWVDDGISILDSKYNKARI